VSIIQPSGLPIKVSVEFDGSRFGNAMISGPVQEINTLMVDVEGDNKFVIK
jgi:hypothetical protein